MTAPRYRSIWAVQAEQSEPLAEPQSDLIAEQDVSPDTPEAEPPPANSAAPTQEEVAPKKKYKPRGRLLRLPVGALNAQLRAAIVREEELRGLSRVKMSRFTGVGRTSLRRFLKGEGLTLRSLEQLARRLKWRISVVNQEGKEIAATGPKE